MFNVVKGFKKEDLKFVVEEINETVPPNITVAGLKKIILDSTEYKESPDFVQEILVNAINERKLKDEQEKLNAEQEKLKAEQEYEFQKEKARMDHEQEKLKAEQEKLKAEQEKLKAEQEFEFQKEKARMDHELQMARVQAQDRGESTATNVAVDMSSAKRKFTLPRLEFRQFGDEIKDWLPFWSQFEQIHKDEEIPPEDKFQYLIQATVVGSRAREVVESFPPTGANYSKAIESLQSRFGREDILVEFYVRELLKLIISVQTKEKVSLTFLYDKLESYLRALESLEVTTEVNACILYPMVESCFPAEFLKAWNRSTASTSKYDAKNRLQNLMEFLKTEVQSEERINLAVAGFGLNKENQDNKPYRKKNYTNDYSRNKVPTAAGLLTTTSTTERNKCIFCEGKHLSSECFTAQKMSLTERQKIVKDKRCCFACLSYGHPVKNCRAVLRCLVCAKKHVPLMCDKIKIDVQNKKKEEKSSNDENEVNMSNMNEKNSKVFLQTIKAIMISGNKKKVVRLLLDSGSQRTYILKSIAKEMNCARIRQEKLVHSLFGGASTKEISHNCYKIRLRDLKEEFACNFDVMDQDIICENIRPVCKGPWISELELDNISLTDMSDASGAVDILIGADIMGKLLTGKKKMLSSGLVAVETFLGWTLMGKVPEENSSNENLAMTVTSMFVKEADISSLWRLDLIGITDPIEKKSRQETDLQTKEHFLETVQLNREGRYEVRLPWADDKSPLPDNLHLAKKRLDYTTSKLDINLYQGYENVFSSWLEEGIIEEVPQAEVNNYCHYLPHRPVIKPSSATTPIRPVFDASAKQSNHPSLNQCLECGPNMIESLPDLLLQFREKKIGVIGDIRRAFCQISIHPEDRDFLRFLWWENVEEKKLKYFRHARVVFGVKCSPFLLASVIDYHIRSTKGYDHAFLEKLARSFYVDNVVTSVNDTEELENFIRDSTTLMSQGRFQLGEWEHSGSCTENEDTMETHVLGLIWNKVLDTLKIDMNWIKEIDTEKVTKRSMLSTVHKVFDPFGFVSPVMLCPKLMLQKAWKKGITWDEDIKCELRKEYLSWLQELELLKDIEIPRYINITDENMKNCTLHTFVDGSQDAYAAVIFLSVEKEDNIEMSLLASKSRVSSLRGTTIPRMELLAAVIGARLANSIIEALHLEDITRYYWSDSTTVLAWILRNENWSVFVRNRVKEIRELSDPLSWRYVPGEKNPADLPSRGCRAKQLLASKWWEGPQWMKDPDVYNHLINVECDQKFDEDEIVKEKSKSSCSLTNKEVLIKGNWYYERFSKYDNIVRLVAWILRFKHNCLNPRERRSGELTAAEFSEAEERIILMIQSKDFTSENDDRLKTLQAFKDEKGVIRLKTKITYRKDKDDFLKPAVLPASHEVVKRLIIHVHEKNCHAGVQILMNILREKYWILQGRKTIKQVLANCVVCKRYCSKNLDAVSPPLPENRVKDAAVFQVTGIDMAGPLFLKGNLKSWVVIFTCAIYRAVHFELVTAASTEAFLMALRRFVSRRGRCSTVYCDNGTNFSGAANALKKLDWQRIQRQGAVNAIDWKFNPPTAAWWGGWWERLIRILKDLLKRVLGKASLNYEEMITILADCESVINSRPLTYIPENEAIKPITPSMFLQDIQEYKLPDIDAVGQNSLTKRIKYRHNLIKDLRNRFRSEYLGNLIQRVNKKKPKRAISVGDVVLVGADNKKRIDWPLGRISAIIPGKDGEVRLVKVQTENNELLRPIQRLYPLEIESPDCPAELKNLSSVKDVEESEQKCDLSSSDESKCSRYGRKLKIPKRLLL